MPKFFFFTSKSGRRYAVNVAFIETVFEAPNGGFALSTANMPDDVYYELSREDYNRLLKILGA